MRSNPLTLSLSKGLSPWNHAYGEPADPRLNSRIRPNGECKGGSAAWGQGPQTKTLRAGAWAPRCPPLRKVSSVRH